jgi:hypothetical protein
MDFEHISSIPDQNITVNVHCKHCDVKYEAVIRVRIDPYGQWTATERSSCYQCGGSLTDEIADE